MGIEGVLRRAARSLIEQAIKTEVAVLLEEFAAVHMVTGDFRLGVDRSAVPSPVIR